MTKKKKRKSSSFLLFLAILIVIAAGMFFYYTELLKPVSEETNEVIFEVRENAGLNQIIDDLYEDGIIRSDLAAKIYIRNKNYPVKAGSYQLDRSYDVDKIMNYISDSDNALVDTVRITFIEGDWLKDFVRKLAKSTVLSEDEIMEYLNDEQVLQGLVAKYDVLTDEIFNEDIRYPLEGYLFPDTYDFYIDTSVEAAIAKLLDETERVYQENKADFDQSELSVHDVFTLASIVQYEAGAVPDMKLIAGVFYNRLDRPMPLQSSATVCYALNIDEDDNWEVCETNPEYDSKYNTYMYSGLTPGPIFNSGEAAVEATLNPTDNDYYYFMADVYGDGTIHYAETYAEHKRNVDKYLR